MLNRKKMILMLPVILLFTACSNQNRTLINITNPTDLNLKDALIETSIDPKLQNPSLMSDDEEIPFQLVDEDGKRILKFVTDITSHQTKEIRLEEYTGSQTKKFNARTYAELSMKANNVYFEKRFRGNKFENVNYLKVPARHTDHDALFKYEGPGWESEEVGYRFYLDWRNATDIFGKNKNQLILDQVGNSDTVAKDDSYHSMQEWGMDIFKLEVHSELVQSECGQMVKLIWFPKLIVLFVQSLIQDQLKRK